MKAKVRTLAAGLAAVLAGWGWADEPARVDRKPAGPEALEREIQALRPKKVPWRAIEWKKTLLEGIEASRKARKPLILWVFIDRPADDERC